MTRWAVTSQRARHLSGASDPLTSAGIRPRSPGGPVGRLFRSPSPSSCTSLRVPHCAPAPVPSSGLFAVPRLPDMVPLPRALGLQVGVCHSMSFRPPRKHQLIKKGFSYSSQIVPFLPMGPVLVPFCLLVQTFRFSLLLAPPDCPGEGALVCTDMRHATMGTPHAKLPPTRSPQVGGGRSDSRLSQSR